MPIDASRYPLITKEYRFAEVKFPTVASTYAKARELELESAWRTLNAGVSTIATAIANIIGTPKRRLEVVVSGTSFFGIDSFLTVTPTVELTIPELNVSADLFAITRAVMNEEEDLTVFEAWGGM